MKTVLKTFVCIAMLSVLCSNADELISTTQRSVKQIQSFLDFLGTDKSKCHYLHMIVVY